MNELRNRLLEEFRDKEYRHGYVDEFMNSSIATQIKVLREQRGWTQKELADAADMKQSAISRLENANYSGWNIKTLRRLAEAFDVALSARFETFGSVLSEILGFSRESLERVPFDQDAVFSRGETDEHSLLTASSTGVGHVGGGSTETVRTYQLFPQSHSSWRGAPIWGQPRSVTHGSR